MPQRVAKIEQEYAGRIVKPGESFEVEPGDVQLLLDLGRIERTAQDPPPPWYQQPVSPTPPPAVYQTRDMQPAARQHGRRAR